MINILLALVVAGSLEPVDPQAACEAASMALIDMRYVEGKFAPPGDFTHQKIQNRLDSCVEIATLAESHGRDVMFTAIAVAYNETNFRKGVSGKAGELGRLQVTPKTCLRMNPGKMNCTNPEKTGVRLLRSLLAKHSLEDALWRYNGRKGYGVKVAKYVKAIQRSYLKMEKQSELVLR